MKKFSKLLICMLVTGIFISTIVMAASDISIYVDNDFVSLTDVNGTPVYPFVQNGTTYVPLRGVSQALDCTVDWDGANRNVLIYKDMSPGNKSFRNNSDDIKIYLDDEEKTLYDANGTEVKPIVKNGTTYVPLRGISNVLGHKVEWEGSTKSVYVWKDEVSPNGDTLSDNKPYDGHYSTDAHYEIDGDYISIDGTNYTNALSSGSWSDTYAMFHLDGKYNKISFVAGALDGREGSMSIIILVDGEIVDEFTVDENMPAEYCEANLNYGLVMKVILRSNSGLASMGDIRFYGE